tara:strand:- start:1105 stop:1293 length:189 start_codon:yes stop_codon:yes gene_type:complete
MKFGREFREALEKEGYPATWVETAIPYRQLKKLLKKARRLSLSHSKKLYKTHVLTEIDPRRA